LPGSAIARGLRIVGKMRDASRTIERDVTQRARSDTSRASLLGAGFG